jgi:hypothetical protein
MDEMQTYRAALKARGLAETLFRADSVTRYAGKDGSYHLERATEEFAELADLLGYDLVKRDTAKEPAQEAA